MIRQVLVIGFGLLILNGFSYQKVEAASVNPQFANLRKCLKALQYPEPTWRTGFPLKNNEVAIFNVGEDHSVDSIYKLSDSGLKKFSTPAGSSSIRDLDPDAISTDNFFLNEVTGAVRYPSTHEAVIIDENTILAMRTIGQTRMTMQKLDNIDALVTEIAPRLKAEYGTVTDEAITEAQKDLDAVCREQECQGSICIAGRPSQALIRQERSDLNENKADLDSCSKIANSDISQATKTQAKILQKLGEMLDVLDTESKKTLPTGVYNPNEPSTEL